MNPVTSLDSQTNDAPVYGVLVISDRACSVWHSSFVAGPTNVRKKNTGLPSITVESDFYRIAGCKWCSSMLHWRHILCPDQGYPTCLHLIPVIVGLLWNYRKKFEGNASFGNRMALECKVMLIFVVRLWKIHRCELVSHQGSSASTLSFSSQNCHLVLILQWSHRNLTKMEPWCQTGASFAIRASNNHFWQSVRENLLCRYQMRTHFFNFVMYIQRHRKPRFLGFLACFAQFHHFA